ncbi:hypothetical protein Trydic_g21008, partial [Trypoxylus dichotomus]
EINYCPEYYTISPYDKRECVRHCDTESCGKGSCSKEGRCVCHLGYRPDPLDPRRCTKFPKNPPVPQRSVCRENSTPKPNIIYNHPGYDFNDTISGGGVKPNISADDDRNLNETGITRNVTITDTGNPAARYTSCDLYIPICVFIFAILLATVCVIILIIIKLKRTTANQANSQPMYEEVSSITYYSVPKIE